MRIVDKNSCYVQKDDLMYLYETDKYMPTTLLAYLRSALVNKQDFIKVEDVMGLEYLFTSEIPTFDELIKLRPEELNSRIYELLENKELTEEEMEELSLKEIINEQKRRAYLLGQYSEIRRFKEEWTSLEYPDIPFPYMIAVTNGDYNAQVTYNLDRIVVYNEDGTTAKYCEDKEFCEHSFKELTHHFKGEQDINLEMGFNGEYFVVKNKNSNHKRLLRPKKPM